MSEQSNQLDEDNCTKMEEGVVCVYTVPAAVTGTGIGNIRKSIAP
jgi:hypothetical protein